MYVCLTVSQAPELLLNEQIFTIFTTQSDGDVILDIFEK